MPAGMGPYGGGPGGPMGGPGGPGHGPGGHGHYGIGPYGIGGPIGRIGFMAHLFHGKRSGGAAGAATEEREPPVARTIKEVKPDGTTDIRIEYFDPVDEWYRSTIIGRIEYGIRGLFERD